ncbi:MAG: glycosyltransferase family 1 protein [Planctomycetes bacterium]|nr:glycosyltransferase family 1 protein [Planctomycetota bacterium]
MARILIATDAWHPQVSGVVRTLDTTARLLREWGHAVEVIEPSGFPSLPVPFYPEIPLCTMRAGRVYERAHAFKPDYVHISTEGPLGFWVRRFCRRMGWRFTTSYHTRFPEYLHRLARVPEGITYRFLKWFHGRSSCMMVATPSLERELIARGFRAPIRRWSRGVDLDTFRPRPKTADEFHPAGAALSYPRPVLLYVGRVSHEKGIDDFLKLKTGGTKVVVGDGPARAELERRYRDAVFLGYRRGEPLGEVYAAADLFVFPSRTDTFGMVVIEALASGLPVAAYPVTGPMDIVTRPELGALSDDLGAAVGRALEEGEPEACAEEGARYTWENCTRQFLDNMVPCCGPVTE